MNWHVACAKTGESERAMKIRLTKSIRKLVPWCHYQQCVVFTEKLFGS